VRQEGLGSEDDASSLARGQCRCRHRELRRAI
jgi:hypothetical protein